MVIRVVKVTGNKKPLSSSANKVAKPKGAVLQSIVVKYDSLSNIVSAKRLLQLVSSRHPRLKNYYNAKLQHLIAIKESNHGRA